MIQVRRADERGHFDHGWLDTYHSFSFADYYDPSFMGYRSLRVINDDRVAPAAGFPTHGHSDMEIVTYVLEGALQHRDSMGNGSVLRRGHVQRMTAGTGVMHSEFNPSKDEALHLLQIWIVPEKRGLAPGYEEKVFSEADKLGRLKLVASRDGRDGSVTFRTDASLYASILDPNARVEHALARDRFGWLQIASGAVTLNGEALRAGDGAAISATPTLEITGRERAELLLFDLG